MNNKKKTALLILDGWGISSNKNVSAIAQAKLPYYKSLVLNNPNATLLTDGLNVGLPKGQMGNSEVGHMNIGAGRVIYQDLVKINKSIEEGSFFKTPLLLEAFNKIKKTNQTIHLLGLVSDGGVHSHINHLKALVKIAKSIDHKKVFIHAITDGRDTDPKSGYSYLNELLNETKTGHVKLASVIGRYYAMDRDNRWDRIKKAYDLYCSGIGTPTDDILSSIKKSYEEGITDEFLTPFVCTSDKNALIKDNDLVIFFNFRADRPRELTFVLSQDMVPGYQMTPKKLDFISFTEYDKNYKGIDILFTKEKPKNTLGEQISKLGKTQLRVAETEKYAHVTYFFSGGKEDLFDGENRILIPSPKVATYDMQPEMSAFQITDQVIEYIQSNFPDFICLNYANADMVGHTGIFDAAIKATETVDKCLSRLIPVLQQNGYETIIIADHGNSDNMINPDGTANTQHSLNPVPIIYIPTKNTNQKIISGILADVAPTLLHLMDLEIPKEMTGKNLISQIEDKTDK